MKHSLKITIVLLVVFLLAQFIGVGVLYSYIDFEQSAVEGKTVFEDLPIGERPPVEEATSYLWILLAVIIGTGLLLLIIKYRVFLLW
ncbi:hypothetical protein GOV03_02015, partial [Candidatus Woesearchaeota archaeon]|nr:hypothetical protein [Candidatus Woesearchaeota archaeon]